MTITNKLKIIPIIPPLYKGIFIPKANDNIKENRFNIRIPTVAIMISVTIFYL